MLRTLVLALAFVVSTAAIPTDAQADMIAARKATAKKKSKPPPKRSGKRKAKPARRRTAKAKPKSRAKAKASSTKVDKRPMP